MNKILVADDETMVRRFLKMALPQLGFDIKLAASGEEALSLYRKHPETYTLILLDVRMPGLSGPETLVALQEINPRVRAGFMTGEGDRYPEAKLLKLGALFVLRKPFTLAELS